MLFYFLFRITSATGAFLYPTYASYKTLARRPASEADLERWLMYWSVLGTIVGVEYVAEWLVSWIPFYHLIKTLFLLYLAFPQTRGAAYIYTTHLHPLLAAHEADIDATLERVRGEVWRWARERVRRLWAGVGEYAGGAGVSSVSEPQRPAAPLPSPDLDPRAGASPAQLAFGLWRTYGPALAALLSSAPSPPIAHPPPASAPPSPPTPNTPPTAAPTTTLPTAVFPTSTSSISLHDTHTTLLARRRALEAELASLPLPPQSSSHPRHEEQAQPQPQASMYLPAGDERGRYEEIGKEDVEGEGVPYASGGGGGQGWGWWWGGRGEGYERVKSE